MRKAAFQTPASISISPSAFLTVDTTGAAASRSCQHDILAVMGCTLGLGAKPFVPVGACQIVYHQTKKSNECSILVHFFMVPGHLGFGSGFQHFIFSILNIATQQTILARVL